MKWRFHKHLSRINTSVFFLPLKKLPSKFLTKSKTVLTGITQPEYRKAVQDGCDIEWRCRDCFVYDVLPDFESTRMEDGICYVMLCYVMGIILCYLVMSCHGIKFARCDYFDRL